MHQLKFINIAIYKLRQNIYWNFSIFSKFSPFTQFQCCSKVNKCPNWNNFTFYHIEKWGKGTFAEKKDGIYSKITKIFKSFKYYTWCCSVKNTRGGLLLIVKLHSSMGVVTFSKLYKCYQIAQHIWYWGRISKQVSYLQPKIGLIQILGLVASWKRSYGVLLLVLL